MQLLPDELWSIVAEKAADDYWNVHAYRRINRLFRDVIARKLLADDGEAIAAYMDAVMHRTTSDRVRERWILRRRCSVPRTFPEYVCSACLSATHALGGCEDCARRSARTNGRAFPWRRCVRGPLVALGVSTFALFWFHHAHAVASRRS